MLERETILPLALGLAFAVLAHLTAGVVAAHWLVGPPREIDRAEREQEKPEQAKLADLVAEAVDVSEPRVAGQPSRVNVRIANRGEASAESFAYVLRIEDEVLMRGFAEAGLAAGATLEHEVEHTVARGGTHRLSLEADPEQAIEDGDRANNRLSVSYFWAVPPEQREEGVDVAVAELRIGEPRIVGAPVTVSGRVVNQGRSAAGVFNLTLLVDGKPVEERTLDSLGSGASERFVTRIYIDEPGEHEVTLAADLAGITDDLDRSNNAILQVAQWKTAEEMERPKVGQRAPSPVTINWISYEDYEDLVARRAEFEQAAVQPDVEPIEGAATPQDPTPPAPPVMEESTTPPPAPQVAVEPEPTPRIVEPEPTVEQPNQPTVPEEISETDSTAPALELEAEMAAAAVEAEAGLPDPPDAAELDADQVEVLTDASVSEEPVAAVPEEADTAEELAIATLELEAVEDGEPLLPELSEREAEAILERQTPLGEVDERADPTDRSLQLRVEALLDRREVTLPLPAEREADPGSPQEDEADAEAMERETETADRPVDPSQPLRDGATEREQEQTPESPTEEEVREMQRSEEARPTAAPRDERESPPVSRLSDLRVKPGRVIARQGIEIRTVEPRFSNIARRTALPRDPDVLLTFNTQGEVIHAQILRTTGYANVDGPVLASLYRWSATGPLLEQVDDSFTLRVRILFNVTDEGDGEEDDDEAADS